MADRVDVGIEAGDGFARAGWNHRDAGGQEGFVAEGPDQGHHAVRRPRGHKEEADRDRGLEHLANVYYVGN